MPENKKRKRKPPQSILAAMVGFTTEHTQHEYKEGGHLELAEYLTDSNNINALRILAEDPTHPAGTCHMSATRSLALAPDIWLR